MTDFCGPLVTGLTWFHIFTERNDLGGGGGGYFLIIGY